MPSISILLPFKPIETTASGSGAGRSSRGYFSQSIASAEFQAFRVLRKHCPTLRFETPVFARLSVSVLQYAAQEARQRDGLGLVSLVCPLSFSEKEKREDPTIHIGFPARV